MPPIDPFKLDDPRIQRGLESIAKRLAKAKRELPYYNEDAALKVKAWLDELHLNGAPVRIQCETSTARLKYYQGGKYLHEKIDKRYEDIMRLTKCTTTKRYIELSMREHKLKQATYAISSFSKDEFIEFVNTSIKGTKFYRETILTDEEINWINNILAPLGPMFISSVTEREVKVIRVE